LILRARAKAVSFLAIVEILAVFGDTPGKGLR